MAEAGTLGAIFGGFASGAATGVKNALGMYQTLQEADVAKKKLALQELQTGAELIKLQEQMQKNQETLLQNQVKNVLDSYNAVKDHLNDGGRAAIGSILLQRVMGAKIDPKMLPEDYRTLFRQTVKDIPDLLSEAQGLSAGDPEASKRLLEIIKEGRRSLGANIKDADKFFPALANFMSHLKGVVPEQLRSQVPSTKEPTVEEFKAEFLRGLDPKKRAGILEKSLTRPQSSVEVRMGTISPEKIIQQQDLLDQVGVIKMMLPQLKEAAGPFLKGTISETLSNLGIRKNLAPGVLAINKLRSTVLPVVAGTAMSESEKALHFATLPSMSDTAELLEAKTNYWDLLGNRTLQRYDQLRTTGKSDIPPLTEETLKQFGIPIPGQTTSSSVILLDPKTGTAKIGPRKNLPGGKIPEGLQEISPADAKRRGLIK